jgi:LysR family glycine cleavage system transcriptional activator
VALAYDAMARTALAEGRLVRLFDVVSPSRIIYSFAYPRGRRRCPDIESFRNWIFAEIEAEGLLEQQALPLAAE